MNVVIFRGGPGLRMADTGPSISKPMVPIGHRPILWRIMKYSAHHGHKDFVLCLGHKADVIKDLSLNHDEAHANDPVPSDGGRHVELLSSDIGEWRITFVDMGLYSIGERLAAVRHHVEDEDHFFATYGDAVTDAPLADVVAGHIKREKATTFLCGRPTSYSFHTVALANRGVTGIQDVTEADIWINGVFSICRSDIFDYIHDGEDLVAEPFVRSSRTSCSSPTATKDSGPRWTP
jgi:glucose-1-phosphate cytidylyltransferase